MNKQTLVVIGNGMVGQRFLEELHANGLTQQYEVVTFCEEPRPAYDRVHLSEYFAGTSATQLSLVADDFFARAGITVHIGDKLSLIHI